MGNQAHGDLSLSSRASSEKRRIRANTQDKAVQRSSRLKTGADLAGARQKPVRLRDNEAQPSNWAKPGMGAAGNSEKMLAGIANDTHAEVAKRKKGGPGHDAKRVNPCGCHQAHQDEETTPQPSSEIWRVAGRKRIPSSTN